jgi:SAM-dependent methyltransferase
MTSSASLHSQRSRAESFGSVAAQYDRYRPAFPATLLDALSALRPASVLDVGSGTGKVAAGLSDRGLDVLGVEVDPRMAEIAREKGARVEIARFEDWDDAGRRFDLVTCGDAWHWIEPHAGIAKVAAVLRAGGTFAHFWNCIVLGDDVLAALADVYRAHAPAARLYGLPPPEQEDLFAVTERTRPRGPFAVVETVIHRWEQAFGADDWVHFLATISDHQRLGAEPLAVLQRAVRDALARFGDVVHAHGRTYASIERRA